MKVISDSKILFHSYFDNKIWASKKKEIITSSDLGRTWLTIVKVKSLPLLSGSSLFNRLTRNGISNIINITETRYAIVIKKKILIYENNKLVKRIEIDRGSRPIRQCIINFNGNIVYGDYWDNADRKPANIYMINGATFEKEVLVSINNVRHIHFVKRSEINPNILYIGTGDLDEECGIYEFDIDEKKLTLVGGGSQAWRAVSIIQKGHNLYWGTDAPNDTNYIYKYNLEESKLYKVSKVDGPIFYSAENSEGRMLFASIVEYREEHKAKIYTTLDGEEWVELQEWKKDFLPLYLFGFGVIDFINGQEYLEDVFVNKHGLN